ncbi:MAG: hypothetical protein ABII27_01605 [bacterium]
MSDKKKKKYNKNVSSGFWGIVRQIVRDKYDLLKTERLRQGYYIVRDELAVKIGKEITRADFDYFADSKSDAYNYYTQDVWTQMERKGYKRPEAKPVGSLWTHRGKYPIEYFYLVWNQARGFIFTEKSGEKLESLTKFGWMIIEPEKGFPTRLIRDECKKDGRPVLAIHDADGSGKAIYRALGEETKRTTHLDISIDDVTDLGLRWDDVKRLNLAIQPEVEKYKKESFDRCELESLIVLKSRHGIENPFLDYVIMRMIQEGIKISPTEIKKKELLKVSILSHITHAFREIVDKGVEEFVEELKDDGDEAVSVDVGFHVWDEKKDKDLIITIKNTAKKLSSKMEKKAEYEYEQDYDDRARDKVSNKFAQLMEG